VSETDPNEIRADMQDMWEQAAPGWGRRATQIRDWGMPVSAWLIEHLGLQPGWRVLELAAGPGDTGFLAAELIQPGGTLISSDGAEAMLNVARARAEQLNVPNVEFRRLDLEWIDLPTADVDAVLCRWGLMLTVDPESGAREVRRVLKPGGRFALAVWDRPTENPWATVPTEALVSMGLADPRSAGGPGMFALAIPGALAELLEGAGFLEVTVKSVALERVYSDAESYLNETLDLSRAFAGVWTVLDDDKQAELERRIGDLAKAYTASDGSLRLPGQSLVAVANA
jgi:ubiquinone/menaquinone biosynthesis C-methylase UbiE